MKRAIFPDGKLLQPIPLPEGGHANISGNINSSTTDVFTNPQSTDNNTNDNIGENNSTNTTQSQNPNDNQNIPIEKTTSHYYIWFSIIFIIIILFIWKFKKIKNYLNETP